MPKQRKITVHLPEGLLEKAQRSTKEGVTETIRQGLKLIAAGEAYEKLSRFRGKYRSSLDLAELRKDRS